MLEQILVAPLVPSLCPTSTQMAGVHLWEKNGKGRAVRRHFTTQGAVRRERQRVYAQKRTTERQM